jgi:hypothetical protein
MQSNALRRGEIADKGAPRSTEFKMSPRHLKFPSVVDQVLAHKNAYNYLKIEPVMECVQEGDWSPAALPEGAMGWYAMLSGSEHYAIDASTAKRKLAVSRAFNDTTSLLPDNLRRTARAHEAFFRLRQLQPLDIHIVAVQFAMTELGGYSIDQRIAARRPNEHPMGVREVADGLRIINRLESPQDLGIDCGADRIGTDIVPCFSIENRALKLSSRSVSAIDYSFAEATWFMPEK